MTGQLNTNLMNSNSEEIQEELDTLSNRLDGVESVTSANTDKINEVGNKVDNLANCVSTDSLNATNVAACNIQGSSATITDINANNITVSNKIKAATIEADNITGNINGDISANRINVCSAHTINVNATGKITAADAKITTLNAASAKICQSLTTDTLTTNSICNTGDATIAGCLNVKGICLTNGSNLYGNAVDVFSVWSRGIICGLCHANIDGNLTVKGTINGNCINGKNITSNRATITSGTIDNLTVNCALTVAEGITLTNVLGDTTLTKVTTDCLLVNGDTELNGAVKAGSITIGDGSITAGEVCIGAKGIVIDKDKNATLADVTANTVTTDAATISGKVTAACTESTDIVATNTFTNNFYPVNITIDKDVGDLHYSRQLDTDAVGGVLVDCKTILPKEVTHSVFPKNGYIESEISAKETTYAKNKALEYSKRGNGLSVSSKVYRPDVCHSNYKTAVKFITGCSDPGITGCCGKGFTVENNGANGLSVSYFYDNCHCPFIDYNFCDTNKNTSTVISSCNLDVTSKNINVKNISTCSVSDDNKVLKVDNCGNIYSGKITSSLIGDDNVCCTNGYTCLYQTPTMRCCYQIYCVGGSSGSSYKENIDEKYYYCNTKKLCNVSVTDYRNKCGCVYIENITPTDRCYSYCKFGRAYNPTTCVSCESYCLDCYCSNIGNPTVLCHHYYCCCSDNTANTKNYWDEVRYFSGGRYNQYGLYPTYICRCFDCHPELSFCAQICNDNLYITNPQCHSEDILRVQDGKIYTKCGEFKAGGGVFDNSTATICDNFATYNLGHSVCTCERTVKISTSITCAAENCCPITFSYGYDGQNPYIEATTGYDGTRIDLPRASICYSNSNGDVVANVPTFYCSHCQEGECTACIECNTLNKVCSYDGCCGFIVKKGVAFDIPEWMEWRNLCGEPVEIGCYYSRNGNETKRLVYCVPFIGTKYSSLDCEYISDCACYDVPHYIFNASYNFSDYKYCDWTENKLIETCTYTSKPVVLKYSKQQVDVCWECYYCPSCGNDQWQPKAYRCPRTDTCFYPVENGYRIDTTSSGCYQSKVTTNTIANLPITNTLVPLAGKVNGKGFAFFCKGADGTKFYDGAFATVDAGTATDVTYLVTTGV